MHVLVGDPLPRGGASGEAAGGGVGEEVELLDSVDVGRHGDGRAAEEGRAPARQEGGDLGGPQSLVDGPGPWVPVGKLRSRSSGQIFGSSSVTGVSPNFAIPGMRS